MHQGYSIHCKLIPLFININFALKVNTIRWCFGRYQYDSKDGSNRATIRVNSLIQFRNICKFSDPDIVENRRNWNVGLAVNKVHRKSQSPIRKLFNALSPDSFMNRSN